MAIGDSPADYAWAANDKELQTYSEAYRTIYTGYKPFIPLTQNYSMAVKAEANANAVNQKKGFFQFHPEGSGVGGFTSAAKKSPEWGGAAGSGDLSNMAAYTLAREVLEQVGTIPYMKSPPKHYTNFQGVVSDMEAAGKGNTATSAGKRASMLAKELETIINLDMSSIPTEKRIKGESRGEVRTQGMVNFLINNQGLFNESKFLNEQMKAMLKIRKTHKITDEETGGFSSKGFDIGYYSEQDVQTLSYLTQRFRSEFDIPDFEKIVGMEETNMVGKKLFQKIGKHDRIYNVSKETVQQDLQREMDKIMGKVEYFISNIVENNLSASEMVALQKDLISAKDMPIGGNEYVLDNPVLLSQEVWQETYGITQGKGHETLTSFSAQVMDRLYRAYNTNIERGLDGAENSGYMYIVPVKLNMDGKKSYSLVGVHIYGDFQKTGDGVKLVDIQNKVYNLGVFNKADQVMLDTWMQKDLLKNGHLGNKTLQIAAQRYREFIGTELQMFYGSSQTIGTQILMNSLSGDAFQTNINFVSTMTSADMAKSFQDQIEAQLSSGAVSKEFKKFYDKMTGDADDLTKTWKAAVGANLVQDFSKVFKQTGNGAFVKGNTFGIKSGMVWPDHKGIGQSGGFTNRQSGAMEGFAFTPFIDTTKESFYYHSKATVFKTTFGKGKVEEEIKDIIKKRKMDEKMGRTEMMGNERIGGRRGEPLMRILWRNGKLEDGLATERENAIEAAMGHLEEAGLL